MDLQRSRPSFAATPRLPRSKARGIGGMIEVPFETRNHDFNDGNAEFRTREIHGYDPLNSDRTQSLELPVKIDRDIFGIVAGNVTKQASLADLRNGVQQGGTQFLFRRLRIV